MSEHQSIWRNPPQGFRAMPWDPVAIVACGLLVWWAWPMLREWSLIAPYVLGTFFLFCNVFRIRRNLELWWAATFVLNTAGWLYLSPSFPGIALSQLPMTALVIALEVRSERYHGVFSVRRQSKSRGPACPRSLRRSR